MEDLVVVTPDGTYGPVLDALLKRTASLGIRPVVHRIVKDALHDSGGELPELLRPFLKQCRRALAVRDLAGSGWESRGARSLEAHLRSQMHKNGWTPDSCAAIVVEPEIEIWMRMPSAHIDAVVRGQARVNQQLSMHERRVRLENIIVEQGGRNQIGKPAQPKEVFEGYLKVFGVPRSNALYGQLAAKESLLHCAVDSFKRLSAQFQTWFPATPAKN